MLTSRMHVHASRTQQQQQQSLFVLTLAQKYITAMKILKVRIRALSAWNNHSG